MPAAIEQSRRSEGDEGAPGEHQLYHVVTNCLECVPASRGLVSEVGHRVGVRLGVIKVVHAGELPPAGVTPDLDQPGPQHDPEDQPPVAIHTNLAETLRYNDWMIMIQDHTFGDGSPDGIWLQDQRGTLQMARKPVSSS